MFKVVLLTLALCSVVLAETSYEILPKGVRSFGATKPGYEVSRPEGHLATFFSIPPDSGGNWGDNLWKSRSNGDKLQSTEVIINAVNGQEQQVNWQANFPGKSITHIRFLNIGRQRAYVQSISGNGGSTASAVIRISPNQQFRLLIEVYTK